MAHFAKIDENNLVLSVSTLDDKDMLDDNGVPQESIGQQYLQTHNNWPSHLWIQTSYSTCLLYTSPSPRDRQKSRMPSSA